MSRLNDRRRRALITFCAATVALLLPWRQSEVRGQDISTLADRFGGISTRADYRDTLANSVQQLRRALPVTRNPIVAEVVRSGDIVAATNGGYRIVVSEGLMERIARSTSDESQRASMLTFVVGHEMGHSLLGHTKSCEALSSEESVVQEEAADMVGGVLTYAATDSVAGAAESVFRLLKEENRSDRCHGDPVRRNARWTNNLSFIMNQSLAYSAALDDLRAAKTRADVGRSVGMLRKVAEAYRARQVPFPVLDFALGVAYHKSWMLSTQGAADLGVFATLVYPRSGLMHPTKGARTIPGNKTDFQEAMQYYRRYLKASPDDADALLNLATLQMYDESEDSALSETLRRIPATEGDARYLNNLAAIEVYRAMTSERRPSDQAGLWLKAALGNAAAVSPEFEAGVLFNLARYHVLRKDAEAAADFTRKYLNHAAHQAAWICELDESLCQSKGAESGKSEPTQTVRSADENVTDIDGLSPGMQADSLAEALQKRHLTVRKEGTDNVARWVVSGPKGDHATIRLTNRKVRRIIFYAGSSVKVRGLGFGDDRATVLRRFANHEESGASITVGNTEFRFDAAGRITEIALY